MNTKININNFDEISQTIKNQNGHVCDTIFDFLNHFKIGSLANQSGIIKEKGFYAGNIITLFILN